MSADQNTLSLADIEASLALDRTGRPRCNRAATILTAVSVVMQSDSEDMIGTLLDSGFLKEREARYYDHVATDMVAVEPSKFRMGASPDRAMHFCGEVPSHEVELSPFLVSVVPVTNRLAGLLFPGRAELPKEVLDHPATGMTWHDAALFALWVGCQLPTEAEWEYVCGSGGDAEWCCWDEEDLQRFAWYCANSGGVVQPVGTREPNTLGVHDTHGNVWEWCADDYDEFFYYRAPTRNPVNLEHRPSDGLAAPERPKVCRGGAANALAEMCRTRYRFHEPADFWAHDLGFRLARPTADWDRCK